MNPLKPGMNDQNGKQSGHNPGTDSSKGHGNGNESSVSVDMDSKGMLYDLTEYCKVEEDVDRKVSSSIEAIKPFEVQDDSGKQDKQDGWPNDSIEHDDGSKCLLVDESSSSGKQPGQSSSSAQDSKDSQGKNSVHVKGSEEISSIGSAFSPPEQDETEGVAIEEKEIEPPVSLRRNAESKSSRKKIPSGLMIKIRKKNPEVALPQNGESRNEREEGTSSDMRNGGYKLQRSESLCSTTKHGIQMGHVLNDDDSFLGNKEPQSPAGLSRARKQSPDIVKKIRERRRKSRSFKEKLHIWFYRGKVPVRKTLSDGKSKSETFVDAVSGEETENDLSVTEQHGHTMKDGERSKKTENNGLLFQGVELDPALCEVEKVHAEHPGAQEGTVFRRSLVIANGVSAPSVDDYLPVLLNQQKRAGESDPVVGSYGIFNEYDEGNDCYVEMKPISTGLPEVSENHLQMSLSSNVAFGKPSRETDEIVPDDQLQDGAVRRKQRPPSRLSSRKRRSKSHRADLKSCPDLTQLGAVHLYAKSRRGFRSVRREGLYPRVSEDRCYSCKQMSLACICWIPEPDIYEDGLLRGGGHCSDREDSGISQDTEIYFLTRGSRNKSLGSLLSQKSNTLSHHRQEKVLLDAVEKFEDIKEELKATALTIQEAITKLQHDYSRNSGLSQSTDDGNHGDTIPPPERKLVRLCSRNRRCLSKLLAAEWKDNKDFSGSSSIAHSEHSTEGSTDNNDTDYSDSGGEVVHETEEGVLGSNESLRDADIEEEDENEEERPESVVTDIETCKDFVQGLANQVQAMQEALRKSKEDLDDCDTHIDHCDSTTVVMNNVDDCSAESLQGNESEDTLDDGAYETPIRGPTVVHVNSDRHSQSDYEEVSDISEQNDQRSTLTNWYHSDNYINISTYERTDSLQSLTNNNKETPITRINESLVEDTVIYEFPPDNKDKKKQADQTPDPGEITDEEPKAQFRYDGPLIFDEEDKKDIFKMREKDKVKKWDPVPILKELYESIPPTQNGWNGCDASTPSVKSGECSMEGYMDKLPMGRRRASLIKKWKRRYFRCKGGNLFYYEDHKTKKSLGYLHLVGGKVTEISNKVLEVTDMRGRVLLLRCASKMEFEDWKAILNAETGFYLCQRSSYIPTITKSVVIVDLGSCSVRAGILSDCETTYPQKFFPSAAAISNKSKDCIAYGFDAFTPANRASSKLVFPLRRPPRLEQFKLNIQLVEGLLDTAFTELKIDPRAYTVLLVVPFNLGTKSTEKLVEMVFDQFHVEGIFVREQALMSLYSYKATTGIVVNIGEKLDVVPIVDGFIVEKGVCRLPFGGRQITETLTRLLTESGHRFFSEVETVVSRYLKEKACFVAQDYQAELKFCSLDPELCSTFLSLDKFNIPDGSRTIKLDYSRFRSAEGIFHPECWGKDHSGLHTVVYRAIQACNVELRRHMCKNIYLCGGTTLLPGLAERLRSELIKLLPKGNSVRVHASAERYHAAYHGACTLAPLSAFDNLCVTKDEWKQLGAASLVKWENV